MSRSKTFVYTLFADTTTKSTTNRICKLTSNFPQVATNWVYRELINGTFERNAHRISQH